MKQRARIPNERNRLMVDWHTHRQLMARFEEDA